MITIIVSSDHESALAPLVPSEFEVKSGSGRENVDTLSVPRKQREWKRAGGASTCWPLYSIREDAPLDSPGSETSSFISLDVSSYASASSTESPITATAAKTMISTPPPATIHHEANHQTGPATISRSSKRAMFYIQQEDEESYSSDEESWTPVQYASVKASQHRVQDVTPSAATPSRSVAFQSRLSSIPMSRSAAFSAYRGPSPARIAAVPKSPHYMLPGIGHPPTSGLRESADQTSPGKPLLSKLEVELHPSRLFYGQPHESAGRVGETAGNPRPQSLPRTTRWIDLRKAVHRSQHGLPAGTT